MSRTTATIALLLLAPMLSGCAGDGEKMPVTTREACLDAMLEAITLETAHVARQLKQAGTAEGREALEERSRELRRDFEKYSAIRSEEFELPEPITSKALANSV